jgi:hypothetical protein
MVEYLRQRLSREVRRIRRGASINRVVAGDHAQVLKVAARRQGFNIAQTLAVRELRKGHAEELIQAGKSGRIVVTVIARDSMRHRADVAGDGPKTTTHRRYLKVQQHHLIENVWCVSIPTLNARTAM